MPSGGDDVTKTGRCNIVRSRSVDERYRRSSSSRSPSLEAQPAMRPILSRAARTYVRLRARTRGISIVCPHLHAAVIIRGPGLRRRGAPLVPVLFLSRGPDRARRKPGQGSISRPLYLSPSGSVSSSPRLSGSSVPAPVPDQRVFNYPDKISWQNRSGSEKRQPFILIHAGDLER